MIDDPASDNLLLVMEYVEGQSLQPEKVGSMRWEPVPEYEAWRRARDVLQVRPSCCNMHNKLPSLGPLPYTLLPTISRERVDMNDPLNQTGNCKYFLSFG